MSPVKNVFGVVPSKNGNRSQEKWFIFIILLFIVPASLSCTLDFVSVKLSRMATLLDSALRVCCRENALLCFMYFLSHLVFMLGL